MQTIQYETPRIKKPSIPQLLKTGRNDNGCNAEYHTFYMKRQLGSHITVLLNSLLAVIIMPASPAYAVQSHGGTEGLVSHQLGHFLFFTAMLILLWHIKKARLNSPGWQEFKVFLWFILLWNMLTFTGHWMREVLEAGHFIHHAGRVSGFRVDTLFDLIFYLTRLDHLILVPAVFLLLLSIRKWGRIE